MFIAHPLNQRRPRALHAVRGSRRELGQSPKATSDRCMEEGQPSRQVHAAPRWELAQSPPRTASAVDVLQKENLVVKLLQKGVPKYLVSIINNYLTERYGYVHFGQSRSKVLEIRAGCIQGSVLGPILFNILVSDLGDTVSPFQTVAYADDAYVVITGKTHSELENNFRLTLTKHLSWLKDIGMVCNVSKTEIMVLSNQSVKVDLNGTNIESQNSLKVLGITYDSNLKWDLHVEKIIKKCRSFMYGLRYLRRHLNISDLNRILKAQVVSVLSYGAPAWFHRLNYHLRLKIRSAYYHIIRVLIRDFRFKLNRKGLLKTSGMEDLDTILEKRTSCFIFKILNCLEPTNLTAIFISKSYSNDRIADKLTFFDTSHTRVGRACLSNNLHKIVSGWNFPWLSLTPAEFKSCLAAQLRVTV